MDKFPMKLVIDAVTTPLLHARLSEARSPRERAALLRSIAESTLRLHQAVPQMPPRAGHDSVLATSVSDAEPANRAATAQPDPRVATGMPASNESEANGLFDSAGIADQFAAFL
jgi:hypothetical protein